jgi:signal transduction histidine kinase
MQTLIKDLIMYTQVKVLQPDFERTEISSIVEEVKQIYKEELEQAKLLLRLLIFAARYYSFQFKQLLQNLVSNSFKFSRPELSPSYRYQAL